MPKNKKEVVGLTDSWGRANNRKLADRNCESCGILFRPKGNGVRTCSRKCGYAIRENGGVKRRKEFRWWENGRGFIEGLIWINETTQKRVTKHKWIMEQHIGRELLPTEDVSHIDGDKKNNDISNLLIVPKKEINYASKEIRYLRTEVIKKQYEELNIIIKEMIKGGVQIEWRNIPIDGYIDRYEINNIGQVRSKKRPDRLLTICDNGTGYKFYHLYIGRKSKCLTAHRLVALAFIPNPEGKSDVNHKNGLKYDNRAVNLEWVTKSENMQHAIKNGLTTHHSPAKTLHIQRLADMKRGTKKIKIAE